jgi:DNA-binding beta-propeller fold protein YncE
MVIAVLSLGLALVVLVVVSGAIPARAGAATIESGALSQLAEPFNCIGETKEEVAKCGATVPYGLSFAYQAQVSPDSRNAYSVAVNGSLIEYSRNQANGELTVIGCFSSLLKAEPACAEHAEMEVAAVQGPAAIAISPDGASAYVVTQDANNLVEFSRNSETGLLTKIGCITHEPTSSECATTGAKGLNLPYSVTVSPDGGNVYVTGFADEAVAEFNRNTGTGVLTQLAAPNNCISERTLSECGTTTGVIGLKEAIGIAVSPDGKDVYVAAGARSATGDVAAFERGAEGALTQLPGEEACTSETVAGCKVGQYIQGSEDLVVSPDGANVYVNSANTNAVIELKRTGTGALEQLASPNKCVSSEALTGCQEAKAIGGAVGVAVSPDGENLYASSSGQSAVGAFKRGAEGDLEQLAEDPCVTEEASGCEPLSANNLVGLRYARRLTVSPDGTNVYVAGQEAHAIVELARTIKSKVTKISPETGSEAGSTEVTIEGAGFAEGAAVEFGSKPALNVTVNSATSITATSPAGSGSKLSVSVSNPVGPSLDEPADKFTYTRPTSPTIDEIGPYFGPQAGGTEITIIGSEFLPGAEVRFGTTPARSVTVDSGTAITATSPPGAGLENVTVTTPYGTSAFSEGDEFNFVYIPPKELGGLALEQYCQGLGYEKVTLQRGSTRGKNYAYENWACVEKGGSQVLIATSGDAVPSMANACATSFPGVASFAYPIEPENAESWLCFEEAPASGKSEGGGLPPLAKLASEDVFTPLPIVTVVPAPVLAETGNVAPVAGRVLVELPGTKTFVPLSSLKQIPFGTVIEATNGTVSVTTANPDGTTQTGQFFDGQFILTQGKNGQVLAKLSGGNFSVCPTARERAHRARVSSRLPDAQAAASGKHVVRKLWANAHGKFSTEGNYAAGAVQGTEWLTEDLCEGTLIRVTRDKVAVTNLVTHKHIEVKTGHKYLAKAP